MGLRSGGKNAWSESRLPATHGLRAPVGLVRQEGLVRAGAGFRGSHGACPQDSGRGAGRPGLLRREAATVGAEPARFQAAAAGLVRGPWNLSRPSSESCRAPGTGRPSATAHVGSRLPLLSLLILQGLKLGICLGVGSVWVMP